MKKSFGRHIRFLDSIHRFIVQFVTRNRLDEMWVNWINLMVEELYVNTVKYNPESKSDILLELLADPKKISIIMTTYDVKPFDITKTKDFNLNQYLKELRVGGLGIPLVKKMSDEISFDYNEKKRSSKLTLIKYLEEPHV